MSDPIRAPAAGSDLAPLERGWLGALALVAFAGHMAVAGNYGYFRDELYYLVDGLHLQAGYVDQPLLMGWLSALLRVTIGEGLVQIHLVPALAVAGAVVINGLIARELGGGRLAQVAAGLAALFCLDYLAIGSLYSMDVLDMTWWGLAILVVARILRRDDPRLYLVVGLISAAGLLTKLTILFFGLALVLGLLAGSRRRHLLTPWPWLGGAIAFAGLVPYLAWNALNGWATWDFWHHYGGIGTGPVDFLTTELALLNPLAVPLAVAGLVFYLQPAGERFRALGWTFVFCYLLLTALRFKAYFLAPAFPILFGAGGVMLERLRPPARLGWSRPAYLGLVAAAGLLLAPDVMPVLPPTATARVYGPLQQVLADRLPWAALTGSVERVYAGLPPAEQAQACVLASNYGEAGALTQLGEPGRLPPVISPHNNFFLWGPGRCSGEVLVTVGYPPSAFTRAYRTIRDAGILRCALCTADERDVQVLVVSDPKVADVLRLWGSAKNFS